MVGKIMLIASIGEKLGPIKGILEETMPDRLVLITFKDDNKNKLELEVESIIKTKPKIKVLDINKINTMESWYNLLYELHDYLLEITKMQKATVSVTGGTPWLSHTLHHAAIMARLEVVVSLHPAIEGGNMHIPYPDILGLSVVAEKLRNEKSRYRCLKYIKDLEPVTLDQISSKYSSDGKPLGVESIRIILNGRNRDTDNEIVREGLCNISTPLVEEFERKLTGKKGRPSRLYRLTNEGRHVLKLIPSMS
ncbi:hypothetical protein OAC38_00585 [Candidatus Poseidoniaceae archaeon]|nr:hypothetical protein [Candidatus Poseidoniaceae archaeon]